MWLEQANTAVDTGEVNNLNKVNDSEASNSDTKQLRKEQEEQLDEQLKIVEKQLRIAAEEVRKKEEAVEEQRALIEELKKELERRNYRIKIRNFIEENVEENEINMILEDFAEEIIKLWISVDRIRQFINFFWAEETEKILFYTYPEINSEIKPMNLFIIRESEHDEIKEQMMQRLEDKEGDSRMLTELDTDVLEILDKYNKLDPSHWNKLIRLLNNNVDFVLSIQPEALKALVYCLYEKNKLTDKYILDILKARWVAEFLNEWNPENLILITNYLYEEDEKLTFYLFRNVIAIAYTSDTKKLKKELEKGTFKLNRATKEKLLK